MSDQDLYQLVNKCDQLEELWLSQASFSPELTEDGWIRAAPFLKKLSILRVERTSHFQDLAVCAIISSCLHLETLHLTPSIVTREAVSYIMLNSPELVELVLQNKQRIESGDIEDVL
ncbi:hypothetical protein DFS34DRAFT_590145 [Phlyctochytrium arcticum]|nr:hypothetical protein DFS34DRAFT_590145 [Phlyctochytrium arcticum]